MKMCLSCGRFYEPLKDERAERPCPRCVDVVIDREPHRDSAPSRRHARRAAERALRRMDGGQ